ncbi:hypothetical protein BGZ58_001002 [Dissophora ornata]|nr:hypothetical protein BGZ58_001002 [Dissophora ornata]
MSQAVFNHSNKALFNEVGPKQDSTFEILYFGLFGLSATFLDMLAISGVEFTTVRPENWPSEKAKTPFGCLPILREMTSDGKVLEICESEAIERYLGQKFGLMGDDLYEHTFFYFRYVTPKDPIPKAEAREKFANETLPHWVAMHEKHLRANGSNGHYLNNKLTMADLKTSLIVRIAQSMTGDDIVSESKTPAVWKVKTEVEKIPNLQKWKQTEQYRALAEKNKMILGF